MYERIHNRPPAFAPTVESVSTRISRDHWQATAALLLINVLVFLFVNVRLGFAGTELPPGQAVNWGALFGPLAAHGEPWRLITSMFMHESPNHLGSNMILLMWLGRYVDFTVGRWQFLLLYFSAGVFGGLAELGIKSEVITYGASGAIFGIVGFLFADFLYRWWNKDDFYLSKGMIAGIFLYYFIFCSGSGPQTAVHAHSSGFLTGFSALFALRSLALAGQRGGNYAMGGLLAFALFYGQFSIFPWVPARTFGVRPEQAAALMEIVRCKEELAVISDRSAKLLKDVEQGGTLAVTSKAKLKSEILPKLIELQRSVAAIRAPNSKIYDIQLAYHYYLDSLKNVMEFTAMGEERAAQYSFSKALTYGKRIEVAEASYSPER